MQYGEKLLYSYLLTGDTVSYLRSNFTPDYFIGSEVDLYGFTQAHLTTYGKLPSVETVHTKFPNLTPPTEPITFYQDKVSSRYRYNLLSKAIQTGAGHLQTGDTAQTTEVLQKVLSTSATIGKEQKILDFNKHGVEYAMQEITNSWILKHEGGSINLGWPYLDNMTYGLTAGDVVSMIGSTGEGKTFFMLYSALHIWISQKKSVLFVSLEMNLSVMAKRIIAMASSTAYNTILDGEIVSPIKSKFEHLKQSLSHNSANFYVVDANLSTSPQEVYAMAIQHNVDVMFIDGAYLLTNPNKKLGRYERTAENADQIKQLTERAGIPTVASWQFNREAAKKASKGKVSKTAVEQIGLQDIAGTDAIANNSTVVLAIIAESADGGVDSSVESSTMKRICILKGRNSGKGSFHTHWDFIKMNFSQCNIYDNEPLAVGGIHLGKGLPNYIGLGD